MDPVFFLRAQWYLHRCSATDHWDEEVPRRGEERLVTIDKDWENARSGEN